MEGNILECLERKELKREGLELGLPQHYQFQKKKNGASWWREEIIKVCNMPSHL